jgi:hypothetical protein
MKNRKKRAQREEVRKILQEMRLELAAQRLAYEHEPARHQGIHLNELIGRATHQVRGPSSAEV